MKRLFGKKSNIPKPTLADANEHIETRNDVVDARVGKLDAELNKLKVQIAKTPVGPMQNRLKQRALQLLQQKRSYQRQQDGMRSQQFNMDQLQFAVQTMQDTQIQVAAMKDANKSLKKQMQKVNIDKVDDMQADLQQQYFEIQQIQQIMGRSYDVPEDIDEDELLGELNALDSELGIDNNVANDYLAQALAVPVAVPMGPIGNGGNEQNNVLPEGGVLEGANGAGSGTQNPNSLEAQLGL